MRIGWRGIRGCTGGGGSEVKGGWLEVNGGGDGLSVGGTTMAVESG